MSSPVDTEYDFVVIGGGAAGFFAAIACAETNMVKRVAILERTSSVLGKVKISGGGRCNVTHACFDPREFVKKYPRGGKQLIGPFHRWGASETVAWFENHGVPLKTEADGRMFPETNKSQTVIDCLVGAAEDLKVDIRTRTGVESVERTEDGRWIVLLQDGSSTSAKSIMLATGGIRNPIGITVAESCGHTVIEAAPSLFTFKVPDRRFHDLSGISVEDATVSIVGEKLSESGPCLITHWGVSGPVVLRLSARGARELQDVDYKFKIRINWCGGLSLEEVDTLLRGAREKNPKKRVHSGVEDFAIPSRLWQSLAAASGIDGETTWSNLGKEERRRFARELSEGEFKVNGQSLNKDEFVTAGGVSLKEVNFKTMESRLVPGLYFGGEVLDIDGITGGFNFQSAWTTGRIAGEAVATGE